MIHIETIYKINHDLDIPIYRQLVDVIRMEIKKGTLVSGQKLPTVNEMTKKLNIARGTVIRAYEELEATGLVEKIQGRGTFVRYQPANSGSQKEQAMAAIDTMLDQLEDMGFSAGEINIFLNLKLRERSEKEAYVKVAVVECNPENLSLMSEQLRHVAGVDLYSYMLDDIRQYPYKLGEDFDLIVSTSAHTGYLESVLPAKSNIARVALRPSARCLSHIIKLRPEQKIGIVGYSRRFGRLLYKTCKMYAEDVVINEPLGELTESNLRRYLKGKDTILLPKFYEKYFSSQCVEIIRQFDGHLIDCYYEMDEGSVLYLESKIKKILSRKTI